MQPASDSLFSSRPACKNQAFLPTNGPSGCMHREVATLSHPDPVKKSDNANGSDGLDVLTSQSQESASEPTRTMPSTMIYGKRPADRLTSSPARRNVT